MKLIRLFAVLVFTLPAFVSAQYFNWSGSIGSIGWDYGKSISVDGSGNIYLAGQFSDSLDIDPSAGTYWITETNDPVMSDGFVAKYGPAGNLLWGFGIGSNKSDVILKVKADNSGNVYIAGEFTGTVDFDPSAGVSTLSSTFTGGQIWIAKYTSAGAFIWAKTIASITHGDNSAIDFDLDGSGNIFLTGYFQGTVDLDPGAAVVSVTSSSGGGNSDFCLVKLDPSGNYLWGFNVGGPAIPQSVAVDGLGDVFISGTLYGTADFDPGAGTSSLSPSGFKDIYLAKYNSAGAFQWSFLLGGSGSDDGRKIAVDPSNNVIITGTTDGNFDADPGAGVKNIVSAGGKDIFLGKYSGAGAHMWSFNIAASNDERAHALEVDNAGNIYVMGELFGMYDLDPGAGTASYTNLTGSLPIITYSNAGAYVSVMNTMKPTGYRGAEDLTADGTGKLYLTGYYSATINCDSALAPANEHSSIGETDIVFSIFSSTPVALDASSSSSHLEIFPNPADQYLTIRSEKTLEQIYVYNSIGQLVRELSVANQNESTLDVSTLGKGVYLLKLKSGEELISRKILVR